MLFCSLIKGITPKIRMLCFVLINSVCVLFWFGFFNMFGSGLLIEILINSPVRRSIAPQTKLTTSEIPIPYSIMTHILTPQKRILIKWRWMIHESIDVTRAEFLAVDQAHNNYYKSAVFLSWYSLVLSVQHLFCVHSSRKANFYVIHRQ